MLRDVVRIIRTDRPYVIISRFQGTARDGHGNHEAAGTITQRAFTAAGNPAAFPEQIREGLRPWQPLKLYIGGVRENEDWTLRVDPGEFSPWLGASYGAFARLGLSFQRSQNSGRYDPAAAVPPAYYKRAGSGAASNARETGFFDGIDTSIRGVYRALRQPEPPAWRRCWKLSKRPQGRRWRVSRCAIRPRPCRRWCGD